MNYSITALNWDEVVEYLVEGSPGIIVPELGTRTQTRSLRHDFRGQGLSLTLVLFALFQMLRACHYYGMAEANKAYAVKASAAKLDKIF